jgi:enolase
VISSGAHAGSSIDLQEFMVVPAGADSFSEGLRVGVEVYHALKKLLTERGLSTLVGDEGGFAPDLESSEIAIDLILEAAERAGHRDHVAIALDPATSEVFSDGAYRFEGREKSSAEMPGFWAELVDRYPIVSIEDGGGQRLGVVGGVDAHARGAFSSVGDDLFVTNPVRLRQGIERGVGNSILVKVNQIGTLTETIEAVRLAQGRSYTVVMSHRSGETEDATIADSPSRSAPARSRRVLPRARIVSPSTTSCCGSRSSWDPRRRTRGGPRFPARIGSYAGGGVARSPQNEDRRHDRPCVLLA